jgi:hypothetical protein
MNDRLREAISIARSGETREAQLLVAAILENSPDDPQAWYLMSHLVESPARRAVYLYKAVSLDPYNERAKAELAQFPPAVTYALSNPAEAAPPPSLNLASADGSPVVLNESSSQDGISSDVPEEFQQPAEKLLSDQPDLAPDFDSHSAPVHAGEAVLEDSAAVPKPKGVKRRQSHNGLLLAVLALLVIVTIIILGFLGYLLFRLG